MGISARLSQHVECHARELADSIWCVRHHHRAQGLKAAAKPRPQPGQAHELARKGAGTDATKRALATFGNGTLLVTCPALPEVTTFGEDEAEAIEHARDAIEEAIAARMTDDGTEPAIN